MKTLHIMTATMTWLLAGSALAANTAAPAFDPATDLSGFWRLVVSQEDEKSQHEFIMVKTSIMVPSAPDFKAPFYQVIGKPGALPFIGMVPLKNQETGRVHFGWFEVEESDGSEEGELKGTRLDDETTMVLGKDGDAFILGGDFEEEEIGRLIPLSMGPEQAEETQLEGEQLEAPAEQPRSAR